MPKLKIVEVNGRPMATGIAMEAGADKKLRPGQTWDVDDVAPFQGLIDRNILAVIPGRPKAKADASATNPD